jgi:hypothetical protein
MTLAVRRHAKDIAGRQDTPHREQRTAKKKPADEAGFFDGRPSGLMINWP